MAPPPSLPSRSNLTTALLLLLRTAQSKHPHHVIRFRSPNLQLFSLAYDPFSQHFLVSSLRTLFLFPTPLPLVPRSRRCRLPRQRLRYRLPRRPHLPHSRVRRVPLGLLQLLNLRLERPRLLKQGYLLVVQLATGRMYKVDDLDGAARWHVLLNRDLEGAKGIAVVASAGRVWYVKSDDSWGGRGGVGRSGAGGTKGRV